jgi:hypothetical protein
MGSLRTLKTESCDFLILEDLTWGGMTFGDKMLHGSFTWFLWSGSLRFTIKQNSLYNYKKKDRHVRAILELRERDGELWLPIGYDATRAISGKSNDERTRLIYRWYLSILNREKLWTEAVNFPDMWVPEKGSVLDASHIIQLSLGKRVRFGSGRPIPFEAEDIDGKS